jgi:hypothetical protein
MTQIQRSEIFAEVKRVARDSFGGGKFGDFMHPPWKENATPAIKKAFADLGTRLKFRVAGAGCAGADPEWKYDLVWFLEDNEGYTVRVPLILESELTPKGRVDIDFVKLVDGRAEVRVWVSCAANPGKAREHIDACKEQILRFPGSLPDDVYVFIIFEWETKTVIVDDTATPPPDKL